ncbi:type II toxin-antitoxin system PemK/MazF family toxin [Streptomyces sp. NPDC051740]|uniref:type II toxin-antitoxin system PemK/MazF family toxin n=1 Tax=Streptomyces sp. NPDC051740 TaxID=3365673 RepID=UPI0037B425EA
MGIPLCRPAGEGCGSDESRLPKDSKAQCEQVRAVAPQRLLQRVGVVPRQRMADIDVALRWHLAL